MINDKILPDLDEFLTELDEDDLPPLLLPGEDDPLEPAPAFSRKAEPEEEPLEDLPEPDDDDADDDIDDDDDSDTDDDDDDSDDEENRPAPKKSKKAKKKKHHAGRVIIVLLILALLGGAGWYAYPRYIALMLSGTGSSAEESAPAEEPSAEPADAASEGSDEQVTEVTAEPADATGEESADAEEPSDPEEAEPASEPGVIDRTGKKVSCAEILSLKMNRGAEEVLCTPTVGGIVYDGESEELDLTGTKGVSAEDVRAAFILYPQLKRIVIPDDEDLDLDMDALNAINLSFADRRVVWTIHFCGYTLQTDATYFCCNDENWGINIQGFTNTTIQPLRYCIDMVDLDVGHQESLTTVNFVENMKHLKYLVIADTSISDLTPLENLTELYYLEVFMDPVKSIQPLLGLTNLRYLNIGYTSYKDEEYLMLQQMTWLEYFWYPGNVLSYALIEQIEAAMPNTTCYFSRSDPGSTGGGWRQTQGYYDMRDGLHMYYMDG